MKRIALLVLAGVFAIGISRAALQTLAPDGPQLTRFLPAGALLQIQAKDFNALLERFLRSAEKNKWLESNNFEVFSRSRLFLRLGEAGDQFAAAAGLPPDLKFVSEVAGRRSALALYDIGNLEFLYITRLPSTRAAESALWQARAKFETRESAGTTFYLRRDPESGRTVAFALAGEYLLLATREDLLANSLGLLSGSQEKNIEGEPWWSLAAGSAAEEGDVRMVLNLEKIVPSPYFRSYWIQQNITEMKQYSAAISDLFAAGEEFREERALLRKSPAALEAVATDGMQAVAELARLAPPDSGFYRASAAPSPEESAGILERRILRPRMEAAVANPLAPQFQLASGEVGSATDLETRIDVAPDASLKAAPAASALSIFEKKSIRAVLQVQGTEKAPGHVFVRFRTALVYLAENDWELAAVEAALSQAIRQEVSASALGAGWRTQGSIRELDGLLKLSIAAKGKYLMVADDSELLQSLLSRWNEKIAEKPAVMLAGFQHKTEAENFARFASLLARGAAGASELAEQGRAPDFFSGNVRSLSDTFTRVGGIRLAVRDHGAKVTQRVTYLWQP